MPIWRGKEDAAWPDSSKSRRQKTAFATANQKAESVSPSSQETVKWNQQHDVRKAQEIRIRSQLGLAELCLRQVHHWKWQRQPAADQSQLPPR